MRKFGTTLAALLLVAAPAGADCVLLLEDGRILERPRMERVEGGVEVHFENGTVRVPEALVEEVILDGVPAFEPRTPEEQQKAAQGLVPFEGKWVRQDKLAGLLAERIARRRAEIEEIKAHEQWRNRWQAKTRHFEFEYTVPPHVFARYRDLMEAYFEAFAGDWKVKQPRELGRLKVCFYTDADKFAQISGAGRGVLGYFRFVQPLELNFYHDRLDPEGSEQVMYHETNHYLQLLLNPAYNMPHFPGEALAEYYGASRYDPQTRKLETGLVLESRLAEVKMDVAAGELMGLEKMLTTDGMYEHYNWGWSLAHYLMNHKTHRKRFERFVKDLAQMKGVRAEPSVAGMRTTPMAEVWAHFRRCLGLDGEAEVKALEAAWHAYVRDELQLESARGLEEAATRAANLGLRIKAKRLLKEAIEKGSERGLTWFRYAEMLAADGSRAEALRYYRRAVELAPLEARFHARLGEALHASGEVEEGRRLGRLALELDPDDPWLAGSLRWLQAKEPAPAGGG